MTHAARLAKLKGLYGIVDDGEEFFADRLAWARALAEGGAQTLQLRYKRTGLQKALAEARAIRQAWPELLLIVDDRPDLALLCEADGVHLGDDDLPVADARRLLGPEKLVGATARTPEAARARLSEGADHLGVGPVFRSATKSLGVALLGEAGLRRICAAIAPAPVVAISGIDETTIGSVAAAGARAAAVIGAVGRSGEPKAVAARLVAAFAAGAPSEP